ncbi:MAG: phage/plasmid primase, P4 family [Oscillospiraceae bacterium]
MTNLVNPFASVEATGGVKAAEMSGRIVYQLPDIMVNGEAKTIPFGFGSEQEANQALSETLDSLMKEERQKLEQNIQANSSEPSLETTQPVFDAIYAESSAAGFVPDTVYSVQNSAHSGSSGNVSVPELAENREIEAKIVESGLGNLPGKQFPIAAAQAEPTIGDSNAIALAILNKLGAGGNTNLSELLPKLMESLQMTDYSGNTMTSGVKSSADKPMPFEIMKRFVQTVPLKMVGEVLYYYDFGLHYYRQLTEQEAKRLIMGVCKKDVEVWGVPSVVHNVYDFISINPTIAGNIKDTQHPDYLGFRNGILDLRTLEFYAPTPDFFITNIVDDDYDANLIKCGDGILNCCPNFNAFLAQCFIKNQDLINRMWEAIGYILTDDNNGKCFIFLHGPGNCGKSLLIKLISSFFREDAVCSLSINQLGDRFGLSIANGKKLIACADLPEMSLSGQAVAVIKNLTGGDTISFEQKYKDMATFINTAKLIFASNVPISISSQDNAFSDRIVEIPFFRSVPKAEQRTDLLEILKSERHAIIHYALLAYNKLRSRNYVFSGEEFLSQSDNQQIVPTITAEDVLKGFVREHCCDADSSSFVTTENLHRTYCDFCKANHCMPLAKEQFSKLFRRLFGERFSQAKRAVADGSKPRGYSGLMLK